MGWPSLLETPEEKKAYYEKIRGHIEASPLHTCIVEHTYDIIPEEELEKKVLACRKGRGQSCSKTEYDKTLYFLRNETVIDKAMIRGVDGWHYEATPFTKSVIDHFKKTDPKRQFHI